MIDLAAYRNSLWLAEPNRFRQIFAAAALYGKCFTREEVLARHRADLEQAKTLADGGVLGTGIDAADEYFTEKPASAAEAPRAIRAVKGKIGVIPIHGPVDQRMSSGLMKAGGTSIDFIAAAFDTMMAKADIGAIVLHVDSPGGGTYGTEEMADRIYEARGTKPIYSMIDSMGASASFWLASAADMIVMTPGGDVGSVGVYAVHIDESKALEKDGISVTMVSAGKHKVEYASTGPLSDDARANLQESVDATYGKFISALARNRGTSKENVRENYGGGRVFNAEKALAVGMIDRQMPFEKLLSKLVGSPSGATSTHRAELDATVLKMRNEWRKKRAMK